MLSSQKQLFEKYGKHSAKTTPLKKDFYFDFIKNKKKGKKKNKQTAQSKVLRSR